MPRESTFLPAARPRAGSAPFLAAKSDQREAPVFLATKKKSVFLAPKNDKRAPADALLPSRPAAGGDVFMPVHRLSPPELPEP